jgi:hypothetical protein
VRHTLSSLGFDDWRIKLPPSHPTPQLLNSPAGTGGTCGSLVEHPDANAPDSPVLLEPNQRTVFISSGPPQRIATLVYHAGAMLYHQTYLHCYSAASVRALITGAFVVASLYPRFATNAAPAGGRFEPSSQKLYDKGCVRFEFAYVGNDNQFVDVLLYARGASRLPAHQLFPPADAFRS